jgi:hypothetical protein
MTDKGNDDIINYLIKLGVVIAAVVVGLYILIKLLIPSKSKEVFKCGKCGGVIVGRPESCRWCHSEIDWSGVK